MGNHCIRPGFPDNGRQPLDHRGGGGLMQGLGMIVVVSAGHSGIPVVEQAQVGNAGYCHSLAQFLLANLIQIGRGRQGRVADFAHIAISGADQCNPRPPGGQHSQRSAAAKALVIRVGKASQDGQMGQVLSRVGHWVFDSFKLRLIFRSS